MTHLSICIPTYEMGGQGAAFLRNNLERISGQTFTNFEVIVSDHSRDQAIQAVCEEFSNKIQVVYLRNPNNIGSSSANLNNAIKHAKGLLIKVLFQDDFLFNANSLQTIVDNFDIENDRWLITGSEHTTDGRNLIRPYQPTHTPDPHFGNNLLGSPSALTIRNTYPILFDEKLIWFMDGDYYKRCTEAYGPPKIISDITVVNRLGEHQVTATIATDELRKRELSYIKKKFSKRQLSNVTLVAVSSIKLSETIHALRYSMRGIKYGRVVLLTDKKLDTVPTGIEVIPCRSIDSIDEYSRFMLFELNEHIDTEFALVVQYDGYVLRPNQWDPRFLKYDFVGAPWRENSHFTPDGTSVRVGNGGFSLRSKRLLEAPRKLNLPFIDSGTGFYNEDGVICNYYRKELETDGIKYAPAEIAAKFSREQDCQETVLTPFGFHKNWRALPLNLQVKFWLNYYLNQR